MGTQSSLYIEKKDNTFIGTNCYYDGYPEHMTKQIGALSYDDLHNWILIAGSRGGFRLFSPKSGETEFMNGTPHYIYDPDDNVVELRHY